MKIVTLPTAKAAIEDIRERLLLIVKNMNALKCRHNVTIEFNIEAVFEVIDDKKLQRFELTKFRAYRTEELA